MIIQPNKPYESFLDAVESQRELCEYIFDLTEELGMELYPHRFWYRYGAGKIDAPFRKEGSVNGTVSALFFRGYFAGDLQESLGRDCPAKLVKFKERVRF